MCVCFVSFYRRITHFYFQITLNYFLKQATGNEKMETGYPYAHMFSSYKGDSQLPNVSRNGQYCQLDEGFSNNEEKMTQMIVSLGLQNNVRVKCFKFRVLLTNRGKWENHEIMIFFWCFILECHFR